MLSLSSIIRNNNNKNMNYNYNYNKQAMFFFFCMYCILSVVFPNGMCPIIKMNRIKLN